MRMLRQILLRHRRLALVVAMLALALKVLVPGGYMVARQGQTLSVMICSAAGEAERRMAITVLPGGKSGEGSAPEHPGAACPYTALSLAALGHAESVILLLAVGFALALVIAAIPPVPRPSARRFRPPLRGPPSMAGPPPAL